ncbi:MAG: hypothetical protein JSS24_16645 [Proteobacteria bacterium]|nr:hypothetical protein [Pseudomonadota bacterium]
MTTTTCRITGITCTFALSLTGCYSLGPKSMTHDRYQYAASLSDSWNEQTLLNIVKMRYVDPPSFVDVGNIVASYSLQQGLAVGGSMVHGGTIGNSATLSASGVLTTSPTITYNPLIGNKFIRNLATPIPPEQIFLSIQSGLPADVILFASLAWINGLKNQEATLDGITPADPRFHRMRALAKAIQQSGAQRIVVRRESDEELATFMTLPTEHASPQILAEIAEFRQLLGLDPDATEYRIVNGTTASNGREIAVVSRSILGLMRTMAAQVEVPAEDLVQTRAFPGFEQERDVPGIVRLIRIHSGKSLPADVLVNVRYRNTWFWLDDSDLESKQAFALIMMLFTMIDTGTPQNQPVLTIPAH